MHFAVHAGLPPLVLELRIRKAMHYITRARPLNVFLFLWLLVKLAGAPAVGLPRMIRQRTTPNTHTHHNTQLPFALCCLDVDRSSTGGEFASSRRPIAIYIAMPWVDLLRRVGLRIAIATRTRADACMNVSYYTVCV